MTRKRIVGVAFALAIGLALAPALADEPAEQYDAFDSANVWIRDGRTGLRWQRYVAAQPITQAQAESSCAALTLDGRAWRLPSVKELLTIVDEDVHYEYEPPGVQVPKAIWSNAFPQTPGHCFWTTPLVATGTMAWKVDFSNGEATLENPGNGCSFRCVER